VDEKLITICNDSFAAGKVIKAMCYKPTGKRNGGRARKGWELPSTDKS
jgi:hypothetical protein